MLWWLDQTLKTLFSLNVTNLCPSVKFENLFWMPHLLKVQEKRKATTRSFEYMTTLSRSKVWGNDGGLRRRRVKEAMKGKDRMIGSLQLTGRGFSLIRWGICRRHADLPTAHFYDLQVSYASIPCSFTPFLHPPLPCFQGFGRHGWDVVIYTSVHVCALRVCVCGQ